MLQTTVIDLDKLPAPKVIEELNYEAILQSLKQELSARDQTINVDALQESDPLLKLLEVFAVRELYLRQRINEAARSVMLATATGDNLDNLVALLGVERQVLIPEDLAASPPRKAVYETDQSLRARTHLTLQSFNTAGAHSAYLFHAGRVGYQEESGVAEAVKGVFIYSPTAGEVRVVVLSDKNNGIASDGLLASVMTALNDEDVRPITDKVVVERAEVIDYEIDAELMVSQGPGAEEVLNVATKALREYTESIAQLDKNLSLSGLYSVLHQPGVETVKLMVYQRQVNGSPVLLTEDLEILGHQAVVIDFDSDANVYLKTLE